MGPFTAEILGTMILILLGNGVVANVVLDQTKGNNAGWIVITLAWGLAVYTGVVIAGPISGAHLNPAVTLGLAVAGKFAWSKVGIYIGAQMIGACIGSLLVWLSYRDHYIATANVEAKLATFATGPAIRNPISNFITELIGTFVLLFGVLYIAGPTFEANNLEAVIGLGSIGALPVALIVVGIGLSLGGPTGYAINPARDLAPRIMHAILPIGKKGSSDWGYSWIPVIGPIAGAVIAAFLYTSLSL